MIDYNPIGTELVRILLAVLVGGAWTAGVILVTRWIVKRNPDYTTDSEWKAKYEFEQDMHGAAEADAARHRMRVDELMQENERLRAGYKGIASIVGGE